MENDGVFAQEFAPNKIVWKYYTNMWLKAIAQFQRAGVWQQSRGLFGGEEEQWGTYGGTCPLDPVRATYQSTFTLLLYFLHLFFTRT